jgi:hypothetical protein
MESKPDGRDRFQQYIDALENNGPKTTLFAKLQDAGIPLPNPDDLFDAEMASVLWKVIDGMWNEGAVLYSTDHLSDRELYTLLWTDLLLEDHQIVPEGFSITTHLDVLGGWSNEDLETYLRYYADEDTRKEWAEQYGKPLPEHLDPPYDRDRLLPGH